MNRARTLASACGSMLLAWSTLASAGEGTKPGESTKGMDMQVARADMMAARGQKVAYTKVFDLSGIPAYVPKRKVTGTIRLWGSNYITDGNLGPYWEKEFKKFHWSLL
jgi:phosphate transport system substrate-binding protein